MFWKDIASVVTEPIGQWLDVRKAKTLAKISLLEKKADGTIAWETTMAEKSGNSWKDEWFTVIFSIPMMMCFVPGMEEVVHNGFEQLSNTPEWYRMTVLTLVGASVGVRGFKGISETILSKKPGKETPGS